MAEPEDKQKQKGGCGGISPAKQLSSSKLQLPDEKKFEKDIAETDSQIKEQRTKLRSIKKRIADQKVRDDREHSKLLKELGNIESMWYKNDKEQKKIKDRIRTLREEHIKKKDEASSLLANTRFHSEGKIDEMISKLRDLMLTPQLSDSDQRKYKDEIESLEKSKIQYREYTKANEAAMKMKSEIDDLKTTSDSYYCLSLELKKKEKKIKERMAALQKAAKDMKHESSMQKDVISRDIDALYEHRRQLCMLFREQQTAYQTAYRAAYQEERRLQDEERRKRRENRRTLEVNMAMRRNAISYDRDITLAKALSTHLQSFITDKVQGEGESPSSSTTNLDVPEGAAVGGVVSTRDSIIDQKPGEFVRKKDTEEEVLVPAIVRRKSRREKKKGTVSKRLNFNPAILQQFSHLGIQPPSSHTEISEIILKLQELQILYESKSKAILGIPAYSEAGDSGVGGMADISQAQSMAASREDLTISRSSSVFDLSQQPKPEDSFDDKASTLCSLVQSTADKYP